MAINKFKPPVVVVLGHVDHGKTTLLDYIRKTNVAKAEFGGITQHIGAYEITTAEGKKITFIDTPGHEAFTSLRQRGAAVADIALLVIAADSSIQPQTLEALKVIKQAKIPFIVVVNKIDLEGIQIEKVFKDLAKNEVYVEGRGGDVPVVKVSAKKGLGIDSLLEMISLIAELENLEYSSEAVVEGVVIEVKKDKRGIVLTVILRNGRLGVGDEIYVGQEKVKVRALFRDTGEAVKEVFPSTPVELLGCKNMVVPGTIVSKNEPQPQEGKTLEKKEDIGIFFKEYKKKFNFIVKTDTLSTEEVIKEKFGGFDEIEIVKSDIGELTEKDIEFAQATKANILLFNVKLRKNIAQKAELAGVNIFEFKLIYELLDQIEDLIYALRAKEEKEARKIGEGKILAEFLKADVKIAGIRMISGKIKKDSLAELWRGKKNLGETTIKSLYQKSIPVNEVVKGDECGVIFSKKIDFQQGDIVKLYTP